MVRGPANEYGLLEFDKLHSPSARVHQNPRLGVLLFKAEQNITFRAP